jgi:hypothetical protein
MLAYDSLYKNGVSRWQFKSTSITPKKSASTKKNLTHDRCPDPNHCLPESLQKFKYALGPYECHTVVNYKRMPRMLLFLLNSSSTIYMKFYNIRQIVMMWAETVNHHSRQRNLKNAWRFLLKIGSQNSSSTCSLTRAWSPISWLPISVLFDQVTCLFIYSVANSQ